MKKILKNIMALILDFLFAMAYVLIIESILIYLFGLRQHINNIIESSILISYFVIIPLLFKNTFGRRMLKIKEGFWDRNSWLSNQIDKKLYKFPASSQKKAEVLKVIPNGGYWTCPSCNERNKEFQDVCSNCGQEIDKINE